jgi:hypothetical protein
MLTRIIIALVLMVFPIHSDSKNVSKKLVVPSLTKDEPATLDLNHLPNKHGKNESAKSNIH